MYRYNTALPNTRVNYYASIGDTISGVPEVKFNGKRSSNGRPSNTQLDQFLKDETAKTVPMSITPTFKIEDGVAHIEVEVFSEEAMSNIRLQVLLVESVIHYSTPPGSNGKTEFHYVTRRAFPNMNGEDLTIAADETIQRNFEYTLDTVLNPERLYVVAFVEELNNEHNIVQAGKSINIYSVRLNIEQSSIYQKNDPTADFVHTINIKNTSEFDVRIEFNPHLNNDA
jgi:hypothetical protein